MKYQNIQTTPFGHRRVDHGSDFGLIRHIAAHAKGLGGGVSFPYQGRSFLDPLLIDVGEDDPGAFGSELDGRL